MSEMKGKIIKGIAGFYYVDDGAGTVVQCRAKGVFRSRKVKPLVGDNVEFDLTDEKDLEGNVTEILPRKNALIRPAAANVDQALVVFALSHPAPNLNLLDRFLVMMEAQQVPVIICFNKADLADEKEEEKYRLIYEPAGYQVMFTSVREKTGVETVREKLTGKTTVFAGPSGVGKSSLTNQIQPEAAMETGAISEKIRRGRHTTRHSELFFVEPETFVMDTPGFSSIYVEALKPEELSGYFPEFEDFVPDCRFLGCVHVGERECGVKEAVKEGKLSGSRYENYRLIYEELKNKRRY